MAELAAQDEVELDEAPFVQRRRVKTDDEIDITPMIDCTFQLLIFFLVCSVPDPQKAIPLPEAVHGKAENPATAVIVSIYEGPGRTSQIYLGDGKEGEPLPESHEAQRDALLQHFQAGVTEGKTLAIIKFGGGVKGDDMNRVSSVVTEVEGLELRLAVADSREKE